MMTDHTSLLFLLVTITLVQTFAQPVYPPTYPTTPGSLPPGYGFPDLPGYYDPPSEPAVVLYPPMPYDIGALGEPCYNVTADNLEGLGLTPCNGQLPAQVCLGSKYFNSGDFLYQFWFRLENGSKEGFSKTNHGIWAGNRVSFLATTNHAACKFMRLSDIELDLQSSPPAVLATETCTFEKSVVTQRIRYNWAPPPFPACTPQLVATTPEVLASSRNVAPAGINGGGSPKGVVKNMSNTAGVVLIVVVVVVGVAILAGSVMLVARNRRAVYQRPVPHLHQVAVNQDQLFNVRQ